MTVDAQSTFVCSGCGKRFRWKPELVGKKSKCSCGKIVVVPARAGTGALAPAEPPVAPKQSVTTAPMPSAPPLVRMEQKVEQDLYDVVPDLDKPKRAAPPKPALPADVPVCNVCGTRIAQHSLVCAKCGAPVSQETRTPSPAAASAAAATVVSGKDFHAELGLPPTRRGMKKEEPQEAKPESPFRAILLPIALIAIGLALSFYEAMYYGKGATGSFHKALPSASVTIVANLVLIVAGVFGAAAGLGMAFTDPVWRMILKLCAVALVPGPLGTIVDSAIGGDINGNIAGVFTSVAAYFGLMIALFRLPLQDLGVCTLTIWIIRSFVMYMKFKIEGAASGSEI